MRRLARRQKLLGAVMTDRLDPVLEIVPIGLNRVRAGQMGRHTDDGNVSLSRVKTSYIDTHDTNQVT